MKIDFKHQSPLGRTTCVSLYEPQLGFRKFSSELYSFTVTVSLSLVSVSIASQVFIQSTQPFIDCLSCNLPLKMSTRSRATRIVDKSARKRIGHGKNGSVRQIVTPKPNDKIDDHSTELSPTNDIKIDEEEDTAWKNYWSREELLGRYKPIRELGRGRCIFLIRVVSLLSDIVFVYSKLWSLCFIFLFFFSICQCY